jgi:hypothetical protein
MYNRSIEWKNIFLNLVSVKKSFTLFLVNTPGANRLNTSDISSYVSLLITRKREFCTCERNLAMRKLSSLI